MEGWSSHCKAGAGKWVGFESYSTAAKAMRHRPAAQTPKILANRGIMPINLHQICSTS